MTSRSRSAAPRALLLPAAAIAALICVLRLPAMLNAHGIDDENIYSVVGIEIAHGGLPYLNAVERKPPLLFYVYAGVLRVFGDYNWVALHVVATLWALATMFGLYLCGRTLWNQRVGLIAALLYGLFLPFAVFRNLAWNGEMLMNLPLAYALWLTFRRTRGRWRPELFGASLAVGLATLLKQPAAITLLPMAGYVLLPSYRADRQLRALDVFVHALWLGLGFSLTLAAAAWWLQRAGILEAAIFWSIRHHDMPHTPLDPVFWQRALGGLASFTVSCLPLLAASWLALRRRPERDLFAERGPEYRALLGLLLASAIGVVAGGRFYPHYFIQLLPALALCAAPYAEWLYQRRLQPSAAGSHYRWASRYLVANILVFFVMHSWGLWQTRDQSPVALYLRSHARPGDRLFVWGQTPEIYVDSRLRPASRYVATFPLTGYVFASPLGQQPRFDTSKRIVPGSWENLARELNATPPAFIVDADGARAVPRYPIRNYPLLAKRLDTEYRFAVRVRDGIVYARTLGSATTAVR